MTRNCLKTTFLKVLLFWFIFFGFPVGLREIIYHKNTRHNEIQIQIRHQISKYIVYFGTINLIVYFIQNQSKQTIYNWYSKAMVDYEAERINIYYPGLISGTHIHDWDLRLMRFPIDRPNSIKSIDLSFIHFHLHIYI